jgi:hypothetical protein
MRIRMGRKKKQVNAIALTKKMLSEKPSEAIIKNDKRVVMKVGSHDVTLREFKIFELYCKTNSYVKTAKEAGLATVTIYKMRNQEWWGELLKVFIESKQEQLHRHLAENIDVLGKGVVQIWDGTFSEPKLAGPLVKSMEVFAKLGKKYGSTYVDPLIQSKKELFEDNSINIQNTMHIDMREIFPMMTQAEIEDYPRTGKVPERFLKRAKEVEQGNIIEMGGDGEKEKI